MALIGTSARGNERVTFDLAGQSDVWLHARALPGAHVVVRTGGRELPGRVLLQAARLAAHYSRGREAGRVVVDWTLRKHDRKIRGGPPGLVSYVNEQTVRVVPGVVSSEKRVAVTIVAHALLEGRLALDPVAEYGRHGLQLKRERVSRRGPAQGR